jgi:hypothetical protein
VGGACVTHGRGQKILQGFLGKPEGKIPLIRPISRWQDGMDLREISWEVLSAFTWLRIGTGCGLL